MTLSQLVQQWRARVVNDDAPQEVWRCAAELEAWIAANPAAQDTRRLDWLEAQCKERCVSLSGQPIVGLRTEPQWHVHLNGIGYRGWSSNARDTLDAAISSAALPERKEES